MKTQVFTTPEHKEFIFNIPDNAKIDNKGFYIINSAMKEANPHIDFAYLAHDLEYRGLRATTALKVHFANGDYLVTEINGNREKATEYYKIGKLFNTGSVEDNMQAVTQIEFL